MRLELKHDLKFAADRDSAAHQDYVAGCCQSNRNSSPIDAPVPELSLVQIASDCHSANAAERRVLLV